MENVEMSFEDKLNIFKEILKDSLIKSDRVFILPHERMDYDAIASATALYELCNEFEKPAYIVTNDKEEFMDYNLRIMFKQLKDNYTFITTDQLAELRSEKELMILTDTNKTNLIPVKNIDEFKNIVIIDHHKTDSKTVETDKALICPEMSSASEILFKLLELYEIEIKPELSQRLLSGIYLDTNKLSRIPNSSIFLSVTRLVELGADFDEVQNLFTVSNFEEDRRKQKLIDILIDNTKFSTYNISISMNNAEPNTVYNDDTLAQVADYFLQYNIDAAFVIGFIDRAELGEGHKNLVAVKARSKGKKNISGVSTQIDVSEIMKLFDGGGDASRAACRIETDNIMGVKDAINYIMRPGISTEQMEAEKNKVLTLKPKDGE